jgi:hypothetical protein
MRIIGTIGLVLLSSLAWNQSWMQRADLPATGRHRAIGMAIGNKGYVGMGHMNGTGVNIVYHDWWQFDPASNSWTQKADYANGAGQYGACAFSTDKLGFVGGGTAFTNQFFKYDPLLNTWTSIANCPFAPNDQTAFGLNGKGYAIDNSSIAEYDPATDTWTMKAPLPMTPGIWASSFVIGASAFVKFGNTLLEYKPAQNMWIQRATFPGLATGGSSAFSSYGKGYVISGYSGSLANVNKEVWEFNPANNTWIQREEFDGASRRFSIGFNIGDKGYFGLGTNGINFNDFWVFDGILEVDKNQFIDFQLVPNPCTSSFRIQLTSIPNQSELLIYDIAGSLVQSQSLSDPVTEISTEQLPAGVYLVQMLSNNQIVGYERLIKN